MRRISKPAVALTMVGLSPSLAACLLGSPMPPLLQHASSAGGWYGACPPRNASDAKAQSAGLALSPQLNRRLDAQFPPGSRAADLASELSRQGFRSGPSCANDASIHTATFNRPGDLRAIFATHATVFWKVDDAGRILWTKGFVEFTGP